MSARPEHAAVILSTGPGYTAMSLDLRGIANVGEFYSQHYLDALFESDLRELVSRWNAAEKQGSKSPVKRLAALANGFFRALALASGERDSEQRLALARTVHNPLLDALALTPQRTCVGLDDGRLLPVVLGTEVQHRPHLWVIETGFAENGDEADALDECPLPCQRTVAEGDAVMVHETYRELLDSVIFREEAPPRWVLLLGGAEVLLIDRGKWHQGKYLRFDLNALLARRETAALQAMAGLLHRDVLCPTSGPSLLDQVDEKSHKHAYAVSTDLKRGVQEALEVLANEAMHYRASVQKQAVYSGDDLAEQLTRECIVYLYRLLFLFYVEARARRSSATAGSSHVHVAVSDLHRVTAVRPAVSALREAMLWLRSKPSAVNYRAVIVDESQDLRQADLDFLRALVPPAPGDLFIVGDAHQRIYGHSASLSRAGIEVRGRRSQRLCVNYRTTQAIRNWALALLKDVEVDDLDEGKDTGGYHSLRVGTSPIVRNFKNSDAEMAFIVQILEEYAKRNALPGDTCLVARTKTLVQRYMQALRERGYGTHEIKRNAADNEKRDKLRFSTMHRIKGLEFRNVIIVGVQHGQMPLALDHKHADDTARAAHVQQERQLLYVAATRARDELVVTGYGKASEFLQSATQGAK